ncbi:Mucin-associated surface protein (MASP) [Trypanosoma cruzi]|uniref:Mucin-associated surface protein (MASP) n=1 Tax=Trypanosoma cruzi TaxID=5693 RepID=A0A2V2WHM1_TRYCR|nr:Mucin-associated surface protein (MASP) [Trypanosoma cruzi]
MAMMMTGRVLLVCALCVLWCGAGGGYAWDFGNNETLHEKHYGANGTYCRLNSSFPFCEEKRNASKLKEAALKAKATQSGEGSGQSSAGGSSGGQGHGSEGSDLRRPGGTAGEGTQESQPPGEGGTETPTPATVTAAQTSATRTPDDSDSSTAASHTTSPLFLFLLACAAAAAVVAA